MKTKTVLVAFDVRADSNVDEFLLREFGPCARQIQLTADDCEQAAGSVRFELEELDTRYKNLRAELSELQYRLDIADRQIRGE